MSQATQVIHWLGKDTPACDWHAAKLHELASSMGFRVSATPLYGEIECINCKNEQIKELDKPTEKS